MKENVFTAGHQSLLPLTDSVCPLKIVGPIELSIVMEQVTRFPPVAAVEPETYCPAEHEDAVTNASSMDSTAAVTVK